MKYSYSVGIDKAAAIRLSAYGLVFIFIGAGIFSHITRSNGIDASNALVFAVAGLGAIGVHELIHGIFFKLFGSRVRYGAGVKYYILPYAYATAPGTAFSFRQMLVIGLAPFVLLSVALLLLALSFPALISYWSVAFIMNFGGAVGDLWLMSKLVRFRSLPDVKFIDEADGIRIESDDARLQAFTQKSVKASAAASFFNTWIGSSIVILIATALMPPLLKILSPNSPVVIGSEHFYLIKYVPKSGGLEATLEVIPIIIGGLVFALLVRLTQTIRPRAQHK